jgi:hypothetical protein
MSHVRVLCCAILLASIIGCSAHLTDEQAAAALDNWVQERSAAGMPPLIAGLITLETGTLRGNSSTNRCDLPEEQPHDLAQLQRYAAAGILHLDRTESCKWQVTLAPVAEHDRLFDIRLQPPSAVDTNSVSIILARWSSFNVRDISQNGPQANVQAASTFLFTPTMRQLAQSGVWPEVDDGCAFAAGPSSQQDNHVGCRKTFALAFADNRWHVDTSAGEH